MTCCLRSAEQGRSSRLTRLTTASGKEPSAATTGTSPPKLAGHRPRGGRPNIKIPVITLVERGGRARSIQAEDITARTLRTAVMENVKKESRLMTDELRAYRNIGKRFASH